MRLPTKRAEIGCWSRHRRIRRSPFLCGMRALVVEVGLEIDQFIFEILWPSRPGEFHPEPLTDPDLNLSIHPARATH